MNSIIKYMRQMMFLCLFLQYGLPIHSMYYFKKENKGTVEKKTISSDELQPIFDNFISTLQDKVKDQLVKDRIKALMYDILPGFATFSREDVDNFLVNETQAKKYFSQALLDVVTKEDNNFFTPYPEYFKAQGRSGYLRRYQEGEACQIFDIFLQRIVGINNAAVTKEVFLNNKITKEEASIREGNFNKLMANISATITTSPTCFKNYVQRYARARDITMLNRFLLGAVLVYVDAEVKNNAVIEEYNKMSRTEKVLKKLKFWDGTGKPVKIPQDYIYAVMAVLSQVYPNAEEWRAYIDITFIPLLEVLLKNRESDTKVRLIISEISDNAKKPAYLLRHWKKFLGGAVLVGMSTVYYYNRENIAKAFGEGYWAGAKEIGAIPFRWSSYQTAGRGLKAVGEWSVEGAKSSFQAGKKYLGETKAGQFAGKVRSNISSGSDWVKQRTWDKLPNVREKLPNRPNFKNWFGGAEKQSAEQARLAQEAAEQASLAQEAAEQARLAQETARQFEQQRQQFQPIYNPFQ